MINQRTILQYSADKGMHYVQDTDGIWKKIFQTDFIVNPLFFLYNKVIADTPC